jgi:hypothetical protein
MVVVGGGGADGGGCRCGWRELKIIVLEKAIYRRHLSNGFPSPSGESGPERQAILAPREEITKRADIKMWLIRIIRFHR